MTNVLNIEPQRQLDAGLCPRCGIRFGKHRMDETNLQRIEGVDPWLLRNWGPYKELIAPCGHGVKCQITNMRKV